MAINHSFLNHFTTPVLAAFLRSQPMNVGPIGSTVPGKNGAPVQTKTSGCNGRSKLKAVSQGFNRRRTSFSLHLAPKKSEGRTLFHNFQMQKMLAVINTDHLKKHCFLKTTSPHPF